MPDGYRGPAPAPTASLGGGLAKAVELMLKGIGLSSADIKGVDLTHPQSLISLVYKSPPLRAIALTKIITDGLSIPGTGITLPGINDLRQRGQVTGGGILRGAHMGAEAVKLGINPFDQISTAVAGAIISGIADEGFRGDFADAMSEAIVSVVKKTGVDWETALRLANVAVRDNDMSLTDFTRTMGEFHDVANKTNLSIKAVVEGVGAFSAAIGAKAGPHAAAQAFKTGSAYVTQYGGRHGYLGQAAHSAELANIFTSDAMRNLTMTQGVREGKVIGPYDTAAPENQLTRARGLEYQVRLLDSMRRAQGKSEDEWERQIAGNGIGQTFLGTSDIYAIRDIMRHTIPSLYGQKGPSLTQRLRQKDKQVITSSVGGARRAAEHRVSEQAATYLGRARVSIPGTWGEEAQMAINMRNPSYVHDPRNLGAITKYEAAASARGDSAAAKAFKEAIQFMPKEIVVELKGDPRFTQLFTAKGRYKDDKHYKNKYGTNRSQGEHP